MNEFGSRPANLKTAGLRVGDRWLNFNPPLKPVTDRLTLLGSTTEETEQLQRYIDQRKTFRSIGKSSDTGRSFGAASLRRSYFLRGFRLPGYIHTRFTGQCIPHPQDVGAAPPMRGRLLPGRDRDSDEACNNPSNPFGKARHNLAVNIPSVGSRDIATTPVLYARCTVSSIRAAPRAFTDDTRSRHVTEIAPHVNGHIDKDHISFSELRRGFSRCPSKRALAHRWGHSGIFGTAFSIAIALGNDVEAAQTGPNRGKCSRHSQIAMRLRAYVRRVILFRRISVPKSCIRSGSRQSARAGTTPTTADRQ